MKVKNIYKNIPAYLPEELFDIIHENKNIKIERIVSKGHSSAQDFWYDQDMNEFVILLQGRAEIQLKENRDVVRLSPGDYIIIPAHVKHRVQWTSRDEETIWLAVHLK